MNRLKGWRLRRTGENKKFGKGDIMIGIMQGRLTEPKGRGIQFFPFDNWEREFYIAREIGLDEIEFIFDFDAYEQNPLWTIKGREKLDRIIRETNVRVNSVCFDYFMRRPFFRYDESQRKKIIAENTMVIKQVLIAMQELQIGLIEIPLVDNSSIKTKEEKDVFRKWLMEIIKETSEQIRFGLETDLPPKDFGEYIDSFHVGRLGANYDSGNSSGIGYDLYEEVTTLGDRIFNIHIKDRVYHGPTVALGTGSANFQALFTGLREIGYKNHFILQAARGEEGNEEENIKEQIDFVKKYIMEYGIGEKWINI